ncbi:NAD(P)/FAD-dependent oxidoreductase [Paraglaciecola arctica]|uniref:Monooxygenase FAD-binding n=1 Tax=Paraglaciecola arctica BSs20135 TaxID=493475 RepID=K6YKD9_9ALTE|nr:NAD(P)/FAD-dependent oxidoreductase [Paraglaciecola arctica]GAC17083.1 monooxygenase FAD-binding [Paraglaciecola arctica BSs20135]
MSKSEVCDVVIIGAGPAGAIAASMLAQDGWNTVVVERENFPRFSIGESLLPHCMEFVKQAGMLDALNANAEKLDFQFKNGAAFYRKGERSEFNFENKFSDGPGTTFQVKRAAFDKLLADEASKLGADIRYQQSVEEVVTHEEGATLKITTADDSYHLKTRFVLDASGFGRVLPRLLDLNVPSDLPPRKAVFTHFKDNIKADANFDRNKILITVHPEIEDVWYWLIPFSDGTSSLGVVARPELFNDEQTLEEQLWAFIHQDDNLSELFEQAEITQPARMIGGYSSNVKSLYGPSFALLGNAGEFLDPVFSSGVTIAMRSAVTAAQLVTRELKGEQVDWQIEYADSLKKGIDVFKTFVTSWYDTSFQNVVFFQSEDTEIKPMITSILAGYAWDESNPFVKSSRRGMRMLAKLCEAD